jgi:biopolymer transport protein ExbD
MGAKLSGSSGKKYDIQQNSEINVTPFVDVMLVLLIIFMVAAPLATQSLHLDIPPPIPSPPNAKEPPKPALVYISEKGEISVGVMDTSPTAPLPVKVPRDQVVGAVAALFKANHNGPEDQKIYLKADADVPYGDFVDLMNTFEKSGYNKIGLFPSHFSENDN